jgi:hypothetical protein
LGLYSAASLIVAALHSASGGALSSRVTSITQFSYVIATGIWLGYLLREEPERAPLNMEELNVYRNLISTCRAILADIRKAAP